MPMQGTQSSDIHFQASDILVRTDKGIRESRMQTADSALPRHQRTLLLAVDGQSPFRIYARTLENYGDVQASYAELKAGGYVQCSHETGQSEAAPLQGWLSKFKGLSLKPAR